MIIIILFRIIVMMIATGFMYFFFSVNAPGTHLTKLVT